MGLTPHRTLCRSHIHELFPGPRPPLLCQEKGPRQSPGAILWGLGQLCPSHHTPQLSLKTTQGGLTLIPVGQRCCPHLHTDSQGG